ncbi:MAG: hypothetical protein AB3N21_10275 [Ruegeria sp.]|uniref:hypothetical protein n=1 Tax=Ruegeria sp. TaxID=1879320 RepID=UPI00349EC4AF
MLLVDPPPLGLPRLDFIPHPFEYFGSYIVFGSLIGAWILSVLHWRVKRRILHKKIWAEIEAEKSEGL